MAKTLEVTLDSLFRAIRGNSVYTRDYGLAHPGVFPVYSASLSAPLVHIDNFDHEGPALTFTTNGYGGSVQLLKGRFCINGDRALLQPKVAEVPDLRYLRYVVEAALRPLAIGRKGDAGRNEYTKLRPEVALTASVPLLIDSAGNLDFAEMARVGAAMEHAEVLKASLRAKLDELQHSNVTVDCGRSFVTVELGDANLFRLSIGNRVLRKELVADGKIPVYSANANTPMGASKSSGNLDFTYDSLIWGIDGIFDWNLLPAGTKFLPTDHCGRAEVLSQDLDAGYLIHELRSTRDRYGFDRVFRASLRNIKSVSMRVPVTKNGNFDLDKQREVRARYDRVEALRHTVSDKILSVLQSDLTPV